jgi:hypothetical protein
MKTLAILIPSIPERIEQLKLIFDELQRQISEYERPEQVKIITLIDNKQLSIGQKRQELVNLALKANAKYCTMLDDDDYVTANYVYEICNAIHDTNVDLITFNQLARINTAHSIVHFKHKGELQAFNSNGITERPAWHCNVYLTEIAKNCLFGDSNWGEDEPFSQAINDLCETSHHIPHVLHLYQHDSHKTAAK